MPTRSTTTVTWTKQDLEILVDVLLKLDASRSNGPLLASLLRVLPGVGTHPDPTTGTPTRPTSAEFFAGGGPTATMDTKKNPEISTWIHMPSVWTPVLRNMGLPNPWTHSQPGQVHFCGCTFDVEDVNFPEPNEPATVSLDPARGAIVFRLPVVPGPTLDDESANCGAAGTLGAIVGPAVDDGASFQGVETFDVGPYRAARLLVTIEALPASAPPPSVPVLASR